MNVGMKHGLSCCFARVRADVYSLRFKLILDQVLHFLTRLKTSDIFLVRQFPNRRNVPPWNNDCLTF